MMLILWGLSDWLVKYV